MLESRKKLEARKLLVNRADSHLSGARFVRQPHGMPDTIARKKKHYKLDKIFTHNLIFDNDQKPMQNVTIAKERNPIKQANKIYKNF